MQAALTGHLVLSTLHTNSAAAAITRLRDMGVEDYLLTAVLRGVLAQRLVRRLCTACRRPPRRHPNSCGGSNSQRRCDGGAGHLVSGRPAARHAVSTGYRGRAAIAEFLELSPGIERLVFDRADHASIERDGSRRRHDDHVRRRSRCGAGRRDHDRGSGAQRRGRGLSMTAFRYTAIDAAAAISNVVAMEAASEAEVIARLQRQGRLPMRAEPDLARARR